MLASDIALYYTVQCLMFIFVVSKTAIADLDLVKVSV